jgi:hypothetical protein
MMLEHTMSNALVWGFLAFAAGFIGFFGRYLGKAVISRLHRGKGPGGKGASTPSPVIPEPPARAPAFPDEKLLKKEEKVRLKTEKKLAKKGPRDGGQ